jgi:hypothetical protein
VFICGGEPDFDNELLRIQRRRLRAVSAARCPGLESMLSITFDAGNRRPRTQDAVIAASSVVEQHSVPIKMTEENEQTQRHAHPQELYRQTSKRPNPGTESVEEDVESKLDELYVFARDERKCEEWLSIFVRHGVSVTGRTGAGSDEGGQGEER